MPHNFRRIYKEASNLEMPINTDKKKKRKKKASLFFSVKDQERSILAIQKSFRKSLLYSSLVP